MTIKQMLFSALIFSTISNVGLAIANNSNKLTSPKKTGLLTIYTFKQIECYGTQDTGISVEFEGMNQNAFDRLKEIDKENDFILCPCNVPGFPKEIPVYNPNCPFNIEEKTDRCTHAAEFLSTLSPKNREAAVAYFSAAQ